MKTIIIILSMCLVQQFYAQEATNSSITVVIENLKSNDGAVLASLFTENIFLKADPKLIVKSKVEDGKAILIFKDVPAGVYGITVFHDQNENERMDFDASGLPQENYGISNNKFNPYGPPVWSDARFELTATPVEMNIHLTR